MPRLIKFLNKEYNLTGEGETIQIGTLEHYRSLPEEDGVGDYLEGIAGFNTTEDTALTPETAKHMLPGLKKGVVTIGGNGSLFRVVDNCYVFSATWFDKWDVDESIFPQYNSFYTIQDIQKFASFLELLLRRSFTLDDIQDYSLERLKKVRASEMQIGWNVQWDRVNYSREKALEISNSNVEKLSNFNPTDYLQIFCKPEKYSIQNELRFIFRPFCSNLGFLSVKPKPKILSLSLKEEVSQWIAK